jgi:hypothetical protein
MPSLRERLCRRRGDRATFLMLFKCSDAEHSVHSVEIFEVLGAPSITHLRRTEGLVKGYTSVTLSSIS